MPQPAQDIHPEDFTPPDKIPMDHSLLASFANWLTMKVFVPLEDFWVKVTQFSPRE
jgi:hypothetical protein